MADASPGRSPTTAPGARSGRVRSAPRGATGSRTSGASWRPPGEAGGAGPGEGARGDPGASVESPVHLLDAPVLQPLGLLLDLAGETLRERLFVVQTPDGGPSNACGPTSPYPPCVRTSPAVAPKGATSIAVTPSGSRRRVRRAPKSSRSSGSRRSNAPWRAERTPRWPPSPGAQPAPAAGTI